MIKLKKIKFIESNLYMHENLCIVGSSKIILNNKNGKKIDRFKEVVRFNRSKTVSFEKYVGTKTSIRILNNHVFLNMKIWGIKKSEQFFAKKLKKTKILIIAPKNINDEDFNKNSNETNYYYFLNSKKILILSLFRFILFPRLFKIIMTLIFSRKNYSVGMAFVMCLILSNLRPTLFGFDLNEKMNSRSHYYQKPGKPGKFHDLKLEHKILEILKNKNFLKII